MARTKPADRLLDLIDAAVRVFAEKGYRRAQMADIAREMGVSPGLLYSYVESKDALFYLVVDRAFGSSTPKETISLPVPAPERGAIVKRVAQRLRKEGAMPALSAALSRPRAEDPSAEVAAIVGELYAILYRSGPLTTILDRSALDMPELAALFYGQIRGGLVARLARLIEMRIDTGQYRRVPHPATAARLIVETVAWFARNRRLDPFSNDIDDRVAEETTIDFIVNSLVGASTGRRQQRPRSRDSEAITKQR
jgi:AcrR family transcriptional regulator